MEPIFRLCCKRFALGTGAFDDGLMFCPGISEEFEEKALPRSGGTAKTWFIESSRVI
jgi:hypothetical protein